MFLVDADLSNPFIFGLFAAHTAILTLSQLQLKNIITPAVNQSRVQNTGILTTTTLNEETDSQSTVNKGPTKRRSLVKSKMMEEAE